MLRPPRLHAAWVLLLGGLLAACTVAGPRPPRQQLPGPPPPPLVQAPTVTTAPVAPEPAPTGPAGDKVQVGLLLPLTGASAALGQAMLDAAQMALFDLADNRVQLLVRDTGGGPGTAATAAKSAIDDGARLILGPLLAAEVEAAKPVTQAANVPLIAFSTATQLAGNGTWLLGFDPRQEVERVTRYAQAHGHTNFAVLAPANAYGDLAATAARDAVALVGANLARVGRYDPTSPDLSSAVQRFATDVNFDALLLPEGGQRLRALAPLLAFYHVDVTTVKLLGTGLWDEPGLGREPALEGGWYAAPAPASRADFEKRFEALYRHAPPRLATLGYDAMALAAVLARGTRGEEFSPAALTNPSGFAGLDGIFRLRADGVAERGLAVLEVHRTGTTVIDPAPQSFQRPGS